MYSQSQLDQIWNDLKAGKFDNSQGEQPVILAEYPHEHTMSVPTGDRLFTFSRRPDSQWIETPTIGRTNDFSGVMRHPTQLAGALRSGEQLTSIELQHLFRASYLMHDDQGNIVLTPYAIHELNTHPSET